MCDRVVSWVCACCPPRRSRSSRSAAPSRFEGARRIRYTPRMALIDKPERARQLARAIASDLSLYHEKKLVEGIEKDAVFEIMRDEIEEGRALYKSRVTPEIFNMGLYDRALVDMLLKNRGHVKSKIW